MHHLFILTLLFALLAFAPAAPAANPEPITARQDAVRKINLSGRQRMLSQRIAQAACHAEMGVDRDANLRILAEATGLYHSTLQALRNGSDEMGILPEKDPSVIAALDAVGEIWPAFRDATEGVRLSDTGALDAIARTNTALLARSNDVVQALVASRGDAVVAADLAQTIDVAGRQRMLSQRIAKGACFVARGIDGAAAELIDSIALFEASHAALLGGDADRGIVAAPFDELLAQLMIVDAGWADLRDAARRASGGQALSTADLSVLSKGLSDLLREMNTAVGMYESA